MQKRTIEILFAVTTVSVLAGCGTAATTAPAGTSAPPAAATSAPASQLGPGDTPVVQTVREGRPFTLTGLENNAPSSWRVTLASIRCGSGAIFDPGIMAAYAASIGDTPAVPQPQQPGMKFCLVKFAVTNQGNSNQPWLAYLTTVNAGQRAYADAAELDPAGHATDTGYDGQNAYANAQPQDQTSDYGLQPGTSGASWAVFEVPASVKVTSVSVPAGQSIADSAQVLIEANASN
jgi:hypothetical protein